MARTLDQVLSDVTAQSDPQRQTVLSQIADLPNQQAAQTAAIGAQKDQAYGDILSGAQERGLGFSGIPLGEQAKYAATTYAPALANLNTSINNQKSTLEGALSQIGQNDYSTALGQFNTEQSLGEQQREFDAQQKAAAAQQSSLAGLYGNTTTPAAAKIQQRTDKGFNFQDANGSAISAAQYAQLKGIPFRDLLAQMAKAGDAGAQQALGYVGNDFGYNAPKVGSDKNTINLLNNLLWGVNNVNPNYSFSLGAK